MANSDMRDSKADVKAKAGGSGQGSGQPKEGPPLPKDGQVMVAIMKDMGITDYEPKVVNQLLEFSYRYVTNVLEDAKVLSNHAGKKQIDTDDVKLSVQMYCDQNMTTAPSREMLLEQARIKNRQPLPVPRPTCGLRLPPDRHCFTACNYRLKYKPKPGKGPGTASYGMGGSTKIVSAPNYKPGTKIVNAPPMANAKPNSIDPMKPLFKINANPTAAAGPGMGGGGGDMAMPKIQIQPQGGGLAGAGAPQFKIQINPQNLPNVGMKRKAEEMGTGSF